MKPPRITIYTSNNCSHCKQLKQWLQKNKLRYQEFNIESSRQGMKAFQRLGGRGVPLIQWGNETIAGFNAKKLKSLIDATKFL